MLFQMIRVQSLELHEHRRGQHFQTDKSCMRSGIFTVLKVYIVVSKAATPCNHVSVTFGPPIEASSIDRTHQSRFT
jgi:hypothetical protein